MIRGLLGDRLVVVARGVHIITLTHVTLLALVMLTI